MLHEPCLGQKPVGEHRCHGQGDDERRQDRDDVGDAQRREEPAFHAAECEERDEDEHDEDRAEDDRVADLAAGLVDNPQRRLRLGEMGVFAEPPEDVLDVHDGVVHEFPDGHRQAAEGHGVDRHPEPLEDEARDHDRERDGRERDEGGAEVEQEQEKHDDHEDAAVAEGIDHVADAQIDKGLLLVELGLQEDVGGERGPQFVEGPGDLVREPPRVGPWLLGDHEDHGGLAVDRRVAALHLRRLGHAGHLPEHHGTAPRGLHDHRHEIVHALNAAERADEKLVAALREVAPRGVGVAGLHGGLHLVEREAILQEQFRIDEHLELLPPAAHRHHLRDAGDRQQPLPHHPVCQRADLHRRRGVVFARHAHVHHLPHDRGDGRQLRTDAPGHAVEGDRDLLGDHLPVDVDIGSPRKLDVDHRQADAGGAPHGLHARGAVEHRLERKGDERLDLLGGEARGFREHGHPRPV